MCDFKPGDEIVCIDAKPDDLDPKAHLLTEGRIYVATVVDVRADGQLAVAFRSVGGARPNSGYAFCVRRFRKVQRRDLSAWLKTATDFEEPKRVPSKERA